jgi:hypothetical protein
MPDEASSAKAFQAIGQYFCTFSKLDRELGETIKVALRVQDHEAGNMIVAALVDVARKASLVRAAIQIAKNADGSDTTEAWKESAGDTMSKILACNNNDRVLLAHSLLEPKADGAVQFTRLHIPGGVYKSRQETWTEQDFTKRIEQLEDLTTELQSIRNQLNTLRIEIPDLGWTQPTQPLGSGPLGSPRVLLETYYGASAATST